MKKIFLTLTIILLLTGCNKSTTSSIKLDLKEVEQTLSGIAYSVDEQNKTVDLIFDNNMTVTDEYISNVYSINTNNIESFLISMPYDKSTAEMYAIILPKSGKQKVVEEDLNAFIRQYQSEYQNTEFAEMTKNAFIQSYGDYLIYIISNKSETVYNTITGN